MATEPNGETREYKKGLEERLVDCLSTEGEFDHKQLVIERLVKTDVLKVLHSKKKMQDRQDKAMGEEKTDIQRWMRGALFELLVEEEEAETHPQSQVAKLILSLMHNPQNFPGMMGYLGILRNADLASIVEDDSTNEVVAYEVSDAKSGPWTYQTYQQLLMFKDHLIICFRALDNLSRDQDLDRVGLSAIANRKFRVDEERFKVRVIVPADIDTNEPKKMIASWDFHKNKQKLFEEFLDMQIEAGKLEIVNSIFDRDELDRLAREVVTVGNFSI